MKSFNQFLMQAYLSEAQVTKSGTPVTGNAPVTYGRTTSTGRLRGPEEQQAVEDAYNKSTVSKLKRQQAGPTGAAARPDLQFQRQNQGQAPEVTATNNIASRTPQPTVEPNTTPVSGEQIRGTTPTSAAPAAPAPTNLLALPAKGETGQGHRDKLQKIAQQRREARARNVPAATPAAGSPPAAGSTPAAPTSNPVPPQRQGVLSRTRSLMGRHKPIARGFGVLNAGAAVQDASRGNWGGALENSYLAAMSSDRLNKGAARFGQRAVQSAATRLGMKTLGSAAARFIPGLSTAYGIYRGTEALNKGDYLGAGLNYAAAIPGIGAGFGAAAIAADAAREAGLGQGIGINPYDETQAGTETARSARRAASTSGQYGSRYGSAITGAGGNSFVSQNDQGKTFISTGAGKNRVTTQLAPTQLITDPKTKKNVVADLAFKNGQPVYVKRPDVKDRDTNLWSRFTRWSNLGGRREKDVIARQKEYRTALANTQAYQRAIRGGKK